MEALQRQTAARNKKEVEAWSRRMGERENEAKRREHAERLKQLSVRCIFSWQENVSSFLKLCILILGVHVYADLNLIT